MGSTFEKNLLECMSEKFLRFDRFIQKKMQAKGNTEEERARAAFLEFRKRTHRAEIASLPTMRRWFGIGSYHRPSREQVIHMCFALELQEEEAQEYLTVGLSEPGFQVNDYQEIIFLYGIVNSYSYEASLAMMEQFEESLDKEISFSRNNSTRYLRKDFDSHKHLNQENFLLWMSDHVDWFKGYSQTTLNYLIEYRKVILQSVRMEQEERLRHLLEEIGFFSWLSKHPKHSESRESIRYFLRRKNATMQNVSKHIAESVLELAQVVYQEKDTNISIIREIFEVAKKRGGDFKRNYGETGQIRRITNKYLSDLFSIPLQRERAIWISGAIRKLRRLPEKAPCPDWIWEKANYYYHFPQPFVSAGQALAQMEHEKKEQKRRCIVIQRSDILPLILHVAQLYYRRDSEEKRYDVETAKNYFVDFANTTLNACNMAPLSEKYELDMALLTCFQPEEMYTYPDVLEVLGREE